MVNLHPVKHTVLSAELGGFLQNEHTCMKTSQPWLVWLSGLSVDLRTKGLQVQIPGLGHMPGLQARSPVGGP